MAIIVEDAVIYREDGTHWHPIHQVLWIDKICNLPGDLVGFYDPHTSTLKLNLDQAQCLFSIIKAVGAKFGAAEATKACRNLILIYANNEGG